jgi:large subunit ribosomal protein L22
VRRVLDVIRGRSYEEAVAMLEYMPYKACEPLLVCLASAGANAKNGKGVPLSKQFITEAYADQGPVMKRFRPRAQGRWVVDARSRREGLAEHGAQAAAQ